MSWPMSTEQRSYIEQLRTRHNISMLVFTRLCEQQYGVPYAQLTVREASDLIDSLKAGGEIKRERGL